MEPTKLPNRPKLSTEPCSRFFDYDEQLDEFFVFFVRWTQRPDQMYEDVVRVIYDSEADADELKKMLAAPKRGQAYLQKFGRFVLEMMLVRGTDNFLTYLSQLLALIFTERPETLKSSETVKVEEVLQHPSMDDLLKWLTTRRVERLSYQGMRELQKDLTDKLGMELFTSDEAVSRAVRIIEIRNIFVHNRGLVNQTFQTRTGDTSRKIDSPVQLSPHEIISELEFLARTVLDIDERAALKFGLPRKSTVVTADIKPSKNHE